jgi:hypothetical protein
VSPDWLVLRAPADDSARSQRLARTAAKLAGPGPVIVHDLGSGTGAMMRWLSPFLAGPQKWVLRDADAEILDLGRALRAEGLPDIPTVVTTIVEDLSDLAPTAFDGASLVTASALLDVITPNEALKILAACVSSRTPALFSLTVAGVIRFNRPDPADALFQAAFNAHQRRERNGLGQLGPRATHAMRELFTTAGWNVSEAPTPWRLGAGHSALIAEWLDGWVDAAVEQRPELSVDVDRYRELRLGQLERRALRVEVQHRDLLVWP